MLLRATLRGEGGAFNKTSGNPFEPEFAKPQAKEAKRAAIQASVQAGIQAKLQADQDMQDAVNQVALYRHPFTGSLVQVALYR